MRMRTVLGAIVAGVMTLAAITRVAGNPLDDIKREIEKKKQQQHQQQQNKPPQPGQPQTAGAQVSQPLDATLKEDLMGPRSGRVTMSEDGNHLAIVTSKGSREVVLVDGVEGPVFDEIPKFFGSNGNVAPVLSATGGHSAYLGRRGGDFIAVVDGKEAGTVATAQESKGQLIGASMGWTFWLSHDGSHVAYAAYSGGKCAMVVDGKPGPAYKQLDLQQTFMAGNRLIYVAETDDDKWHAVVDGKPGPAYFKIGFLVMTPDGAHYAYAAGRQGGFLVVYDGVEGRQAGHEITELEIAPDGRIAYMVPAEERPGPGHPPGPSLVVNTTEIANTTTFSNPATYGQAPIRHLAWSPDGKRYAYIQMNTPNPGVTVMVNGKPMGLTYSGASQLLFSPDGSRFAYMANAPNGQTFPVVDGKELEGCGTYWDFVFSNDGKHFAYVARTSQGLKIYLDGKEQPQTRDVSKGSLTFSPDGSRFAYGSSITVSTYTPVVDGETKVGNLSMFQPRIRSNPPIDFPQLAFSRDGHHLAYVANKADGTAKTSVVLDGTWYEGPTGQFSFPSYTPDNKRFGVMTWHNGWALMVDGKLGPSYEDMIETSVAGCRFIDDHTFRYYGMKAGQIYRVTLGLKS